tara:strand:+ start:733 stop:2199 length:1467 start_codon:yes stop_codon:yes gene_type:complete
MELDKIFEEAFQNHKKNNFEIAKKLYKKILEKKTNHFKSTFYLGILSMQTKDMHEAKNWYEKAIQIDPSFPDTYNNLGIILYSLKDYKKAIACYKKAIEIKPSFPDAYNNLGASLQNSGDLDGAAACYEKAIKIKSDYISAYNNLGNVLNELGKYKKAIDCCEKVIKFNPNYASAYNNLGNSFKKIKDYKKAISNYDKAIKVNPDYIGAHNNLGKILRESGRFNEAIKSFEKIKSTSSRADVLECIYFSGNLDNYHKMLEKLSNEDSLNRRVATMSAYVSSKESIKNIFPFCKDPLSFIFIKNIRNEINSNNEFLKKLLKKLSNIHSVWQPASYATKGGYQTLSNLFDSTEDEIIELKKIIDKQIINYREIYKNKDDFFIKKWPKETKHRGWYVKLLKQGHQESHIHPSGWLSGVFYLSIPKTLENNEGSIEFSLCGEDYPKFKNLPSFVHSPKAFDIALFPSSLFHRTIPFNSDEERQVVAFDLVPK